MVVVCHGPAGLSGRLARAGFAVVSLEPRAGRDVEIVLDALEGGALGGEGRPTALVTWAGPGGIEDARVRVPWLALHAAPDDQVVETIVQWLAKHLA